MVMTVSCWWSKNGGSSVGKMLLLMVYGTERSSLKSGA